jgi:hypothetical protein
MVDPRWTVPQEEWAELRARLLAAESDENDARTLAVGLARAVEAWAVLFGLDVGDLRERVPELVQEEFFVPLPWRSGKVEDDFDYS